VLGHTLLLGRLLASQPQPGSDRLPKGNLLHLSLLWPTPTEDVALVSRTGPNRRGHTQQLEVHWHPVGRQGRTTPQVDMATEGTPPTDEEEDHRTVTAQPEFRTSPSQSMTNVILLTTKMERLLEQPTVTTIRLYMTVDHMVKEGSLVRGEVSIMHEGGVLTDSIVEVEDVEDLGDAGGEVLGFLMLLCHRCRRRSVAYSSCVGFEYV